MEDETKEALIKKMREARSKEYERSLMSALTTAIFISGSGHDNTRIALDGIDSALQVDRKSIQIKVLEDLIRRIRDGKTS